MPFHEQVSPFYNAFMLVSAFICVIICNALSLTSMVPHHLIGAFDHTDLSSDLKSGCVLYMGIERFQLSGRHSWGMYLTGKITVDEVNEPSFIKLKNMYVFIQYGVRERNKYQPYYFCRHYKILPSIVCMRNCGSIFQNPKHFYA